MYLCPLAAGSLRERGRGGAGSKTQTFSNPERGCCRLLKADGESATVATLKEYRAAVGRVIERHAGRVVNAPGDNMLVEFASAVEAVQAAIEIQRDIEGRNAELPEVRHMQSA